MSISRFRLAVLTLVLCVGPLHTGGATSGEPAAAQDGDRAQEKETRSPEASLAIARAVAPSLARVEYTLRYDKGEEPRSQAMHVAFSCPSCSHFHGGSVNSLVDEERPLERPAFIISPTRVVSMDMMIHPRFIERIVVRYGAQLVEATVSAYALEAEAVFLDLAKPLEGAKPLAFDASLKGPYRTICHTWMPSTGRWAVHVGSLPSGASVTVDEGGHRSLSGPPESLVVDREGRPVALLLSEDLPLDDSWKGSPETWEKVAATEMKDLLAAAEKKVRGGLLRVHLSFRSPQAVPEERFRYRSDQDQEQATDLNLVGVLVDERTVLVLANLKAKVTARLERIRVFPHEGDPIGASFVATLVDYGALVARLERPLPSSIELRRGEITELRGRITVGADFQVRGEQKILYLSPLRISAFDLGRWRRVYPDSTRVDGIFVLDSKLELAALPVVLRPRSAVEERHRYREEGLELVPAMHLASVLTDLDKSSDKSNVPLTEEEQNRLAWLGVELQPLDEDLARMNQVSDQTRDGETGALVTYVYPDSPAQAAGVQMGDILLRILPEGYPKAVEIQVRDESDYMSEGFPWDQLGELPEQYFDRIPRPWPSADNAVNRLLTDLGFEKRLTLELSRDGKVVSRPLTVVQGPAHYDSAARYKSEALGINVRELTYEVRRYFQLGSEDPGLIISKIEQGSKASVAGLKPYEIITHVNDQPVKSTKDFEAGCTRESGSGAGGELRLSVKRMNQGRIVKIQIPAKDAPKEK